MVESRRLFPHQRPRHAPPRVRNARSARRLIYPIEAGALSVFRAAAITRHVVVFTMTPTITDCRNFILTMLS